MPGVPAPAGGAGPPGPGRSGRSLPGRSSETAGSVVPLVHTVQELNGIVNAPPQKVGVILALPKYSEGKRVNANAYETLKEVCELVEQGSVSPLVIIDNEKTSKIYSNVS